MDEQKYIPQKGDIVWIDFDPSAGKEMNKRRPGVVVSRRKFNSATGFAVVCPITSIIRNYPSRYNLPDTMKTKGQIETAQLKSLDFQRRKVEYIERLSQNDREQIDQLILYIF